MNLSLKSFQTSARFDLNSFIPTVPNNPNSNLICYLSSSSLNAIHSQAFSPIKVVNEELNTQILLFAVEIHPESLKNPKLGKNLDAKAFISPEVFSFLRLKKAGIILISPLNSILPIRTYIPNSLFNYFPNLIIASRVHLQTLKNKNSGLIEKFMLKSLLKKPFVCHVGMEFSLSVSAASREILFEYAANSQSANNPFLDYKKQKKFFKLGLATNSGLIPMDLVHFKVVMIQFSHNSEEKLMKAMTSNLEDSFFLVNVQSETDVFIENFAENTYLTYPKTEKIGNFSGLKYEILKYTSLKTIRNDIIRELNLQERDENNENYKAILLIGKKGSGKKESLSLICKKFRLNYYETDAKKIASLKSLEKNLKKGLSLRPVLINIRNFKSLIHVVSNKVYQDPQKAFIAFIKDYLGDFRSQTKALVDNLPCHLAFTCDKFEDLDPFDNETKNYFDFVFRVKDFSEGEYEHFWGMALNSQDQQKLNSELAAISKGIPWKSLLKIAEKQKTEDSFEGLKKSIEVFKKNKEFDNPSIPNVKWDDVGGLVEAKRDIIDTIMLPQQYPQIFNEFMRPRTGLLFYGPPGTGKTLLAKCVATECKLNFISVKGPELLNMYIGESEKNVREIFDKARKNPPCIIFFDELDALAPKRGMGSDSSNVMDRIVAQFLTELDGVNKEGVIYVIGATNRPDLLDESLLRAGRFDKKIYLGINEDEASRIKTLNQKIPLNFTGADFYGLTSQSVLRALKRRINEVNNIYKESGEKEGFNGFIEKLLQKRPELAYVEVCMQDFEDGLVNIKPSVSMEELKNYQSLRDKFVN